jgi:hypothetical protein
MINRKYWWFQYVIKNEDFSVSIFSTYIKVNLKKSEYIGGDSTKLLEWYFKFRSSFSIRVHMNKISDDMNYRQRNSNMI